MRSYSTLLNKEAMSFKNNVRDIIQNKKRLFAYLFYIALFGWVIVSAMLKKPGRSVQHNDILSIIIFCVLTFVTVPSVYSALKQCPTFFSGADMNLLFTAPISSKKILLFSMLKQTLKYFFTGVLFILFQVATIKGLTTIDNKELWIMCVATGLYFVALTPLNFIIYLIGSKFKIDSLLRKLIVVLCGGMAAVIVYYMYSAKDAVKGAADFLKGDIDYYIPFIGWTHKIFIAPIYGVSNITYLLMFLQVAFIGLCIGLSYHLADDYYEDVLGTTIRIQTARSIMRGDEGRKDTGLGVLMNKNSQVKSKGTGARAFAWKAALISKKTSPVRFISITTILLAGLGLVVGFFSKGDKSMLYVVNSIVAYLFFILSGTNPLENDINKHYFYTIPDNVTNIIINLCREPAMQMLINAAVMNILVSLFIGFDVVSIVIVTMFTLSFYIMCMSATVLSHMLFPNALDQKNLMALFKMVEMLVLLIPAGIAGVVAAIIFKSQNIAFAAVAVINLLVSALLLYLTRIMFERIELR